MGRLKKRHPEGVECIEIPTLNHGTVTFYKVGEGERKSVVWKCFWISADGNLASCSVCRVKDVKLGIIKTTGGSTRGPRNHLESQHPELMARFLTTDQKQSNAIMGQQEVAIKQDTPHVRPTKQPRITHQSIHSVMRTGLSHKRATLSYQIMPLIVRHLDIPTLLTLRQCNRVLYSSADLLDMIYLEALHIVMVFRKLNIKFEASSSSSSSTTPTPTDLGPPCVCGLWRYHHIVSRACVDYGNGHDKEVLPFIQTILSDALGHPKDPRAPRALLQIVHLVPECFRELILRDDMKQLLLEWPAPSIGVIVRRLGHGATARALAKERREVLYHLLLDRNTRELLMEG